MHSRRKKFGGGGVDYSQPLVEIARRALPRMDFICAEAIAVQTQPQYDHCISHSVFQYFDHDYAGRVLKIMATKARKTVTVLDIPDATMRQAVEGIRRDRMSPDEYDRKYAGLQHNYYERTWFKSQADKLGLSCEFIDNQIQNYAQKDFRFSCLMHWMS